MGAATVDGGMAHLSRELSLGDGTRLRFADADGVVGCADPPVDVGEGLVWLDVETVEAELTLEDLLPIPGAAPDMTLWEDALLLPGYPSCGD